LPSGEKSAHHFDIGTRGPNRVGVATKFVSRHDCDIVHSNMNKTGADGNIDALRDGIRSMSGYTAECRELGLHHNPKSGTALEPTSLNG